MKRILLPFCLAAAVLAVPQAASARVVELGAKAPSVTPSCPADPCEAAVRVTGYKGRAGNVKDPYLIRRTGWIVAFTVQLSKPTDAQIQFFNDNFGSPAQVRLSILRKGDTRKTRLNHRLLAQSDLYDVDDFLGSSPTFVLDRPMRVHKGYYVGLTVPTWAPAFANSLGNGNWWRSSRAKDNCDPPRSLRDFALQTPGNVDVFGCTYHGARLLYTVTYVPDNKPTTKEAG
jgi:hypothetical protein